jgi:release factor glutamine methyltransferase
MVLQSIKDFYRNNKSILIQHYPGLTEKRLVEEFGNDQPEQLNEHFSKLSLGIPLEYISGKSYFYNSEFIVNQNTLIPRFETEGLVELAKGFLNKNDNVIDIGTGCGNIILSLIQEVNFPVHAKGVDVSNECIKISEINGFRLRFKFHPMTKIEFCLQDRFDGDSNKYNLIISNPPYIKRHADEKEVHQQVLKYEPHLALFLNDEDYDKWFEDFFFQAVNHLEESGKLLMEGHENHLQRLREMAEKYFKRCDVCKDLTGRDRYLVAYL